MTNKIRHTAKIHKKRKSARFLLVDQCPHSRGWESFPNYNPYHYCYNNPVSFKDPTGLAPEGEKEDELLGDKQKEDELQWADIPFLGSFPELDISWSIIDKMKEGYPSPSQLLMGNENTVYTMLGYDWTTGKAIYAYVTTFILASGKGGSTEYFGGENAGKTFYWGAGGSYWSNRGGSDESSNGTIIGKSNKSRKHKNNTPGQSNGVVAGHYQINNLDNLSTSPQTWNHSCFFKNYSKILQYYNMPEMTELQAAQLYSNEQSFGVQPHGSLPDVTGMHESLMYNFLKNHGFPLVDLIMDFNSLVLDMRDKHNPFLGNIVNPMGGHSVIIYRIDVEQNNSYTIHYMDPGLPLTPNQSTHEFNFFQLIYKLK